MAQIKERDLFVRRLFIYRKDLKKGFRDGFQIYETPHACKGMQDGLGVWITRCGFPDSSTGFLIFFLIGTWISGSNCLWDSGFLELDSGF